MQLPVEAIPYIPNGIDERVGGVLDLAAQSSNVNIDSASATEILVAPHLLKKRFATVHAARVGGQ